MLFQPNPDRLNTRSFTASAKAVANFHDAYVFEFVLAEDDTVVVAVDTLMRSMSYEGDHLPKTAHFRLVGCNDPEGLVRHISEVDANLFELKANQSAGEISFGFLSGPVMVRCQLQESSVLWNF